MSITVNLFPRGTNIRYRIIPVCTTLKFQEAHTYINRHMKGTSMYINCQNQRHFLFPNDAMVKAEVKHPCFFLAALPL